MEWGWSGWNDRVKYFYPSYMPKKANAYEIQMGYVTFLTQILTITVYSLVEKALPKIVPLEISVFSLLQPDYSISPSIP